MYYSWGSSTVTHPHTTEASLRLVPAVPGLPLRPVIEPATEAARAQGHTVVEQYLATVADWTPRPGPSFRYGVRRHMIEGNDGLGGGARPLHFAAAEADRCPRDILKGAAAHTNFFPRA